MWKQAEDTLRWYLKHPSHDYFLKLSGKTVCLSSSSKRDWKIKVKGKVVKLKFYLQTRCWKNKVIFIVSKHWAHHFGHLQACSTLMLAISAPLRQIPSIRYLVRRKLCSTAALEAQQSQCPGWTQYQPFRAGLPQQAQRRSNIPRRFMPHFQCLGTWTGSLSRVPQLMWWSAWVLVSLVEGDHRCLPFFSSHLSKAIIIIDQY